METLEARYQIKELSASFDEAAHVLVETHVKASFKEAEKQLTELRAKYDKLADSVVQQCTTTGVVWERDLFRVQSDAWMTFIRCLRDFAVQEDTAVEQ